MSTKPFNELNDLYYEKNENQGTRWGSDVN